MSRTWNDALQEFTAMTAAINAGALVCAGLLPASDLKTILAFLAVADKAARTPDQQAIVFSLRRSLEASVAPQAPPFHS